MMVRKNGLPRRVYLKHGAYYFVTMERQWIRLSPERDGLPAMYRALAALQETHSARGDLMPAVILRWLGSRRAEWAASTRRNMERIASELSARWAEFAPSDVTTPDCAAYLADYRDRPRTHNQHRDVLRQVLAYAAVQGLREGHNPVDNIGGMPTPGRRRIVTDDELDRLRAVCRLGVRRDAAGRAVLLLIDLALLTGQRVGDLLALRWQDVGDDGISMEQAKTGERLVIEWTPALRAAVAACAVGGDKIGHLIKTTAGSRYTYAGMRSAWDRACKAAGIEDLHIHDLRGRAGTDKLEVEGLEGARALLGHSTQAMTAHYTRGKRAAKVKPTR